MVLSAAILLISLKLSSSLTKRKPTPISFLKLGKPLFQKRLDQDRIRACHGDLHLGNICEWEGQILLFDCIEFNEPFRFVDTMYDIAYIVMDLEVAGRGDLSKFSSTSM